MRRFIVVGHDAPTDGSFSLKDLAGGAGRLDLLVRCVTAAFLLSHGIRTDTVLDLCLLGPQRPPKALRLSGAALRHLHPDERSTAALLRKALERNREGPASPGIEVTFRGLETLLREIPGPLLYLREDGEDLREAPLPDDSTFLLSDHRDLSPAEEERVLTSRPTVVRVGPRALHADHCITLVHNELDRREG